MGSVVFQVLNWVRDQAEKEPDLQQYVPHLQNNTILRLLQQVGVLTISTRTNKQHGLRLRL